ncbi:MAG: hypothetical protein EBV01_15520, partial [Betaproteobacteria bacterium]|nr:hypothetical protein [Betaproteobacteria bacterium]
MGAGQLTLGNVNLSSGADVQAGTLQLGSSAGSGNAGGNISVSNAAILKYYTAAGGWIPLGNTVSGSGDLVFEGTGGSGVGDFGLSRASTNFSGTVRITNSRTWLTSGQAFGNASLVTIQQGGSVSLENVTLTNALSIAGNGWLEGSGNLGAIRLSGSSGVVAGPVTLAADSRIGVLNGSEGRISGVISGANRTLEKAFEGVLWLTGTNMVIGNTRGNGGSGTGTWRGQYYSAVEIYRTNQLGTNVDVRLNPTSGNAYLSLRGFDTVIGNLSGTNPGVSAVVQNTEVENSIGPARLTVTQTTNATFTGIFRNGGTGALALTKNGAATLTLNGSEVTFTGGTVVNEGRLVMRNTASGGNFT